MDFTWQQQLLQQIRQIISGKWEEDPDNAWKQQNESANRIPMYGLVFLSGQGSLITKYLNRENIPEFETFMEQEVKSFLYGDGKEKLIQEWDYIQYWKNMTQDLAKVSSYGRCTCSCGCVCGCMWVWVCVGVVDFVLSVFSCFGGFYCLVLFLIFFSAFSAG